MSRYATHKKQGLIIGSDNMFFCIDRAEDGKPPVKLPEGISDDRDGYGAIVWPCSYDFDQHDSLNCSIRTPAQQLIWVEVEDEYPVPNKREVTMFPFYYCRLNNWVKHWLENNVGKLYVDWDVRTYAKSNASDCIFFKRRKHALAFVKMVEERLKGIKIDLD